MRCADIRKLYKKLKHFRTFKGITVAQRLELLKVVQPVYVKFDHERLTRRPGQKREIGDRRNFTLGAEEHLMVTLMYFHLKLRPSSRLSKF